jgi:hypothetical protein
MYQGLYNLVLESSSVYDFEVKEITGSNPVRLTISGKTMDSALVYRSITQKQHGSYIVVQIHRALVGLAKPMRVNGNNEFKIELTVPDSVNVVRFGRNETLIWRVAPVPVTVLYPAEVAPGPSHLGTGD